MLFEFISWVIGAAALDVSLASACEDITISKIAKERQRKRLVLENILMSYLEFQFFTPPGFAPFR
ncbi:hypothetical protein PST93_20755, partial [Yersinia pestis]|nr:hypothetical protein [Yersinia pestis]